MGTTSEELKRLYSNLGGDDRDTAKTQSPVEVLKKIYEYLGGENPNAKNVQQTGDILNKFNEMDIKLCVDERFYPPIIDEVKGNPVTFSGSEAPLVRCDVDLKPQQDLHGYDKPWVGGAGKNKLDPAYRTETTNAVRFYYNNVKEFQAGTYTFSVSATATQISIYDSNNTVIGLAYGANNITVTLGESTLIWVEAYYSSAAIPSGGLSSINCQFESGSTATTYAPYSNICPITGYDEVGVNKAGKNLYDISSMVDGLRINDDGTIGSSSNQALGVIKCVPGCTYTLSAIKSSDASTSSTNRIAVALYTDLYDDGGEIVDYKISASTAFSRRRVTITATPESKYLYYSTMLSTRTFIIERQLEVGDAFTSYEPYNPDSKTYTIALGDTYYSAHVDVVRGALVADKASNIFNGDSDEDWKTTTTSAGRSFYIAVSDAKAGQYYDENMKCNSWGITNQTSAKKDCCYITSSGNLQVISGETLGITTVADWKTWLSNNELQVCYELATPIEIPLTPTEIFALQGINTMWTNADSLDVEYITDNWNIFHPTIETESTKRKSMKRNPTRNLVLRVPIEDVEPTEEEVEVKEDISEPAKEEPVVKKSVEENPVKEDTTVEEVVTDEQQSV